MRLFQQLLGKPIAPKSLVSRIEKLESKASSELEDIVRNGDDFELRLALLPKISSGPALIEFASQGKVPVEIETIARQFLAQQLDAGSILPGTLLEQIEDAECRLAIAAYCNAVDFQSLALKAIDDQTLLVKFCKSANSARVRQLLAERIDDPELLRELVRFLKGKDKKAYKIVKTKLDGYRAEESRLAGVRNEIIALCDDAEQHTTRHVDKDYVLKSDRLKRRWQMVEGHADAENQEKFQKAIRDCETNIQKYRDELKAAEDLQSQKNNLVQHRRDLITDLWQLIDSLYSLSAVDTLSMNKLESLFDEYKNSWGDLKKFGKTDATEVRDFTLMCGAFQSVCNEYMENSTLVECSERIVSSESDVVGLSEDVKYLRRLLSYLHGLERYAVSKSVKQANSILEQLDSDYSALIENRQKQTRLLAGLINKAVRVADQGRLRQALGIRHNIDEKLQKLEELPAQMSRQLELLDESIQQLVDWQAYAVVPKKQALIDQMEKLVGSDIPPEALAAKIKDLQGQWQSLSQSGGNRGEELWEKFSKHADSAYKPCKEHYQKLAGIRKENLQKREQLVAQLREFQQNYDWENPDWKHVETIVRTARSELHGYAPVERSANKSVMQKFDEEIAKIQERLSGEFEKNKAAKQRLISQAEELIVIADTQQSIDAAKRLQIQWKNVGRCHYRDSDALWKEFRGLCDKVFERKEKENNARKAQTNERIDSARSQVDALIALAELSHADLLSKRSERDEIQGTFQAIEGLPEKAHHAIRRDFNKALEIFDHKIEEVLRDNESQAWLTFFDACGRVNDYHVSTIEDKSIMLPSLEEFVQSVVQWPEGVRSIIKEKITQEFTDFDVQENARQLRLLCIRAEIFADKKTPEEDRQLRMEYQVNLLQQGLGAKLQDNMVIKIAKEWAKAGPVEKKIYGQLYARFYDSWVALRAVEKT